MGGKTNQERYSQSVEILNVENKKSHRSLETEWSINDQKWAQGPPLPCGVEFAQCVPLPPLTNFACVIIGGENDYINNDVEDAVELPTGHDKNYRYSSDVYGLNKELTEWKLLGKLRAGRSRHVALSLSY